MTLTRKNTILELASFSISLKIGISIFLNIPQYRSKVLDREIGTATSTNSYPIVELSVRLPTQHAIMEYKGQSAHRTKRLVSEQFPETTKRGGHLVLTDDKTRWPLLLPQDNLTPRDF